MNDTLANTEKKTAYILTLPAVALVFAIILFPIFANIWISFKEVELKDIRIPEPRAKKIVKSISDEPSKIKILYKFRNSSLLQEIRDVSFRDKFPKKHLTFCDLNLHLLSKFIGSIFLGNLSENLTSLISWIKELFLNL